jgi:hypothetical protein
MGLRRSTVITALAALAAAAAVLWLVRPGAKSPGTTSVALTDVPLVMHTDGGRLEVATITAAEAFRHEAPPRTLLGVDLGTTVSHVRMKVVYRYHIEMAREWPIRLSGGQAIVQAGEIRPTLPVAFDTATMEKETASGWARFDKRENLAELERRLTPELAKRAENYKALARQSARRSVADFVRTWLVKHQPGAAAAGGASGVVVRVRFPDEAAAPPEPAASSASAVRP